MPKDAAKIIIAFPVAFTVGAVGGAAVMWTASKVIVEKSWQLLQNRSTPA